MEVLQRLLPLQVQRVYVKSARRRGERPHHRRQPRRHLAEEDTLGYIH